MFAMRRDHRHESNNLNLFSTRFSELIIFGVTDIALGSRDSQARSLDSLRAVGCRPAVKASSATSESVIDRESPMGTENCPPRPSKSRDGRSFLEDNMAKGRLAV